MTSTAPRRPPSEKPGHPTVKAWLVVFGVLILIVVLAALSTPGIL